MENTSFPILSLGDLPTTESMGGTRRVALEFCLALTRRGHRVIAVAPWTSGTELVGSNEDLEVCRFGSRGMKRLLGSQALGIWSAYRATPSVLSRSKVSLVLAHNAGACVGARWAVQTLQRQVPVVYMFYASHADEIRTGAHRYERFSTGLAGRAIHPVLSRLMVQQLAWLEAVSLRDATRVVTLSSYAKEWAQELYEVEDSRFNLCPPGVDVLRFCPSHYDTGTLRRRLGLPEERFVLFTLRNLHPRMGVDVLVRAMPDVVSSYPDTLLIIGGSGILLEPLRQTVAELNLEDHVRLMGRLDEAELPAYYQAADLFVLPTQAMEGFGMVTLEALACGTPVLGTPVGATPEILSQLGREFLFDGCDVQSLRDGILRARIELSQRSDIGVQCRRLVESQYSWEAAAARLEDVLFQAVVLAEKRTS